METVTTPTPGVRGLPCAAPRFYHVGGTVPRDADCYVNREADRDLLRALQNGEFCYVLTARQMGKSSLMTRAAARLRQEGVAVAVVDLTAFGRNVTAEQWYDLMLARIGRELGLEEALDTFWLEHERLPPLARFTSALEEVVVGGVTGSVVLFIDEIDVVRSLPFNTDELFAAIREFYIRRSRQPELGRLTFCLLGVASPADLIADPRITPFNIGRRIELRDFTPAEAEPLSVGFQAGSANGQPAGSRERAALQRVLYWTGGHPYLTQRLCSEIAGRDRLRDGDAFRAVDEACARLFFESRAAESEDNLRFVADRLLRSGADVASLLDLFTRASSRAGLADDETDPLITALRLSGIVRSERGRLEVRNRIYARVFDRGWIERQRDPAEVRRQRAAYRQGRNRALTLAGVVVTIVGGLAVYGFGEARRADREKRASQAAADSADLASYTTSMNLLQRDFQSRQFSHVATLLEDTRGSRHRGWEWGYWNRLMHRENCRLVGHAGQLRGAAWSPDGKRVLTFSLDHTARIWEAAGGREVARLQGHRDALSSGVWSPDTRLAATGGEDGTVRIWDGATGHAVALGLGHDGPVFSLAWSPDGKLIASGGNDHSVRIWDATSGRVAQVMQGHAKAVKTVRWSPDGRRVASASEDGTVRIWPAAGGPASAVLAHPGPVRTAEWDPSGSRLVTTCGDRLARVWTEASGWRAKTLAGHQDQVLTAAWSPDGRFVATAGADHTSRIWDAGTGRALRTLSGALSGFRMADWSPDGKRIATAMDDGTARIWNALAPGEPQVLHHGDAVRSAIWSPDGQRLLVTQENSVRVWSTRPRPPVIQLRGHSGPMREVLWSPDHRRLLTTAADGTVRVWNENGSPLITLGSPSGPAVTASWSPNGRWIAGTRAGENAVVWDASTGEQRELVRSAETERPPRNAAPLRQPLPSAVSGFGSVRPTVSWSPDGREILVAGFDNLARRWDGVSGQELPPLRAHTALVGAASWSPRGRFVVTVGYDVSVRVWDMESGAGSTVVSSGTVDAAVWSPDGLRFATSKTDDQSAQVWRQATGESTMVIQGRTQTVPLVGWASQATFRGHTGFLRCVAWSPDGRYLATASEDGSARIWQASTGSRLFELSGHAGKVLAIAWSPDGQQVLTAGEDHTARVWNAASGRELAALEHPQAVQSVAWSADGKRIVTACADGVGRIWISDPHAGN